MRGVRRKLGTAQKGKAPATAAIVAKLVKRIPDTLSGKRDKALILIGFAAALRRSELVALALADIERAPGGSPPHISRSKTDHEGPWLNAAAITRVIKGGLADAKRLFAAALAFALRYQGRKRIHNADEIMAGSSPSGLWSILSAPASSS